ncbi:MAG TPA: hypothetical protein VGM92_04920 [Candidatus Kapabacteria bacterium]|jgi:hypothetical protein
MRHTIDPLLLSSVREDYLACDSSSERRLLIEQTALNMNVSVATLYRKLELSQVKPRKRRAVSSATQVKREALDSYGRTVFEFALQSSFDHSVCTYRIAFEFLQESERIPRWVTEQMIYKAIARQDLENEWSPVARRFEREHAMSMYQCDFSVSRHLKHVGNGRLMVRNPNATKMTLDRRRLWVGVAIDDASRVMYMEYFLAKGESAVEAQHFLLRAFARKPRIAHHPNDFLLQGIPQSIYVDRGSGWMDGATQIGLARMGVKMIIGANEKDAMGRVLPRSNKKARGKVEKSVQTLKRRFEMMYSLKHPHGSETDLATLNFELHAWLEEWNQMAHPTRKADDGSSLGKWNLYYGALKSAMYPDENALGLFSRTKTCKVRQRLVNVAPNVYCVAPLWANDGDEVEIFAAHGFYFTMHEGARHELILQSSMNAQPIGETMRMQIERDEDLLTGSQVNTRFSEEMMKLSDGRFAIGSIPIEMWEQIESFFDTPQTVGAIKDKAREIDEMLAVPILLIDESGNLIQN